MIEFLLLFLITFCTLLAAALLINFCKRKMANSRHSLTGMCHKSGGVSCASCGSAAQTPPPQPR